jgi:hypothetical protein
MLIINLNIGLLILIEKKYYFIISLGNKKKLFEDLNSILKLIGILNIIFLENKLNISK